MSAASFVRVGRYFVPLTEGDVVRHFVGHHLVAHDARQRLCGWLARGSMALGLTPLARHALDAGFQPRRAAAPWSGEVRDAIDGILEELDIRDEALRIHLRDPGVGQGGATGGLVFGFRHRESRGPVVVLKVRPRDGARPGLSREWQALHELRHRLPAPLRDAVPEPLTRRDAGPVEIVAMTAMPGRPAYLDLHNGLAATRRAPHQLGAAVSWLVALHGATALPGGPTEDGSRLPDPEELATDATSHGTGAFRTSTLVWLRELREALARRPLPLTASHGDYWTRNLLLAGGRVRAVVDWEHYRAYALPTTDLFHLLISYGLTLRWTPFQRTSPLVAFRRMFVDENRVSRGVRAALTAYAEARDVPLPRLRRLFLLHLLTARTRAGRDGDSPGPDPFGTAEAWRSAYRILRCSSRSVFDP